jgi:beta-mannanase
MPIANSSGVALGAYDPSGDFKNVQGDKIEHIFVPWRDVDLSSFSAAANYAASRGRTLLITIEPWSWSKNRRVTAEQLREGILDGSYDNNIANVCAAVGALNVETTIRFAHEMEDRSGQFIWSRWPPKDYIAAYRRFTTLCRKEAPHAQFMWSPKGESDMNNYYPGDQYVDVIGLTVFGLQQFDKDKVGHDRTFAEILAPGYALAAIHNKPVVVAEVGDAGDAAYVQEWAKSLRKPYPQFPRLVAVVYFDQREVYAWPSPYGLPDWRVVPSTTTN